MEYKIKFEKTIMAWDDALPLGNGDLGCLIYNQSDKLRFSIDKSGIWDCSDSPENQDGFSFANLYELVKNKKKRKINKIFDECYEKTTPTKLPTGKIILNLGKNKNVVSELDFFTAEATLTVDDIIVKSFVHAEQKFGLIYINRPNIDFKIENPQFGDKNKKIRKSFSRGITQSLQNLKYDCAEFHNFKNGEITFKYFIQPTNDSFYGIVTAELSTKNSTLIAYTVGISDDKNFVAECLKIVENALKQGYDASFLKHKKWWQQFFNKSNITLPNKFIEKQWYFNNYLLASCSRKGGFPMPLQGVWTADNNSLPPWKGDYHHDLNTQMSYTSYLKSNHIDEGESFIDFLLSLKEKGKSFAKTYYGTVGLCLPSVMDIKGNALGGWAQYSLSPTNQLWLCLIMARHYFHTGNIEYLKNEIYPYMEEVGTFLLSFVKEKDGFYKLPLSTSPEINDNSAGSWLTPNSNYDLALMRAFAESMERLSKTLNFDEAGQFWKERKEKFEPLAVNDENVLMLSPDYALLESHRHMSHCMSIYPLRTMKYSGDKNKIVIDSTIKNLEELGIKLWVGYSFGWIANLYAIQGDGDKAIQTLSDFYTHYCTNNGFHCNGDHRNRTNCGFKYRHFTLEGNFLATDAINNVLLYSEDDHMALFPAIPQKWDYAEFENLRGYGGVLVSAKLSNRKIIKLNIFAENNVEFIILDKHEFLNDIMESKVVEENYNNGQLKFKIEKTDDTTYYVKINKGEHLKISSKT